MTLEQITMVLLHVKKTDELQFLYETPVASKVDDVVEDLVEIWNAQIQIRRLCDSMEDLALYGPAKKPDKQCIDTYATDDWGNLINDKIPRGPHYCMDPTGKRTGEAPEPRLAEIITKEISNAKKVSNSKEHVERKQVCVCARARMCACQRARSRIRLKASKKALHTTAT